VPIAKARRNLTIFHGWGNRILNDEENMKKWRDAKE
jgi:hypothetical protein